MKKHEVVILILVILSTTVVFEACKKNELQSDDKKVQPVDVRIEILTPSKFIDAIQVVGTVKALEEANISPEEGGVIKEWKVKKGHYVKKGDLIVVLKDEVARASYEAADAQYKMAELNLEKQQKVFEEQGISELQYKNYQYTRDAAKANADLLKARWERTQIRSPIDGIVDNTIPNEGEFAPPGVPLARIVNISAIKIQTEIPEIYSGAVSVGTPAIIAFDAVPTDTLKGRVTFVSSTVSSANRTMQVEIVVQNSSRSVKPDMVAKVQLLRESKQNALLISENLLQVVDKDRMIVYVENSGKAVERQIKTSGRQGNMVEVVEGLNPGDHLIVAGFQKLVDGTPVSVTEDRR